jgi:hypothetical protein
MDGQAHPAEGAVTGQTIDQLAAEITDIAVRVNAVSHRWLVLIAEFDRRHGWAAAGARSCADWLHWRCGLDLGAAREKVRVAHALERLPLISEAMANGELSYSKVRALTRVACPSNEATLLAAARQATASHLETLVRQYRRTQEVAELTREARQFARRQLLHWFDEDGALVLRARLTAEAGALVLKALAAAMEEVPWESQSASVSSETATTDAQHGVSAETSTGSHEGGVSEETSASEANWSARRADALALVAETYLKHGPAALNGGERHEIVLHVSAEMLSPAATDSSGNGAAGATHCELEDGPAVSAETARRLACDASLVAIIEDAQGEPLDVGRKTRTIPPAIRRALAARDGGCVYPGCTHKRYVDGHHLQHWADGGVTKLANLVTLCRFHHRAVHEGGIRVERLADGAWRFTHPGGEAFESLAHGHTRLLKGFGIMP